MSNIRFSVNGKMTTHGRYNVKVSSGGTVLCNYLLPDGFYRVNVK